IRRFSAEPFPLFWLRLFCRCWCRFLFFGNSLFWLQRRFFLFCAWLDLFPFRLLFFRGFFFDDLWCIDPLDECHGSGVALALAELHNARVTAVALRRSWRDVVEQSLYDSLLPQCRECGPARMNRSLFSERNHLFRERSNRLRFGQRCFDALMFDQGANLICQQRFAVLSRAAKFDRLFLVPHKSADLIDYSLAAGPFGLAPSPLAGRSTRPGSNFIPRLKPSCCSLSLISLSDFLPKLRYFSISASVFWASWPTVVIF